MCFSVRRGSESANFVVTNQFSFQIWSKIATRIFHGFFNFVKNFESVSKNLGFAKSVWKIWDLQKSLLKKLRFAQKNWDLQKNNLWFAFDPTQGVCSCFICNWLVVVQFCQGDFIVPVFAYSMAMAVLGLCITLSVFNGLG